MADIFQFYSGSADAAPGKGAGETLVSEPSTYTQLRKIPNWRRLLATGDTSPLSLTGNAELWEAQPRKPKVRRTDLEDLRGQGVKTQGNIPEQADKMSSSSKKSKAKQETGSNARTLITQHPEAVFVANLPPPTIENVDTPDLTEPEESSTIHFCPVCRNYLFAQITELRGGEPILHRTCRNCGYDQEQVKGGLISEIVVGERSTEAYKILLNEFTAEDPRLPHIHDTIKCPDPTCPSNKAGHKSDIIYMKYDAVNLNFLYICYVCKYTWHSTR